MTTLSAEPQDDSSTDTVSLPESPTSSNEPEAVPQSPPPPSPSLWRTVAIILTWYCLSNSIILSTKWLYNNYFSYPLMVTLYYNAVASVLAAATSYHPKFRSTVQPLSRAQFLSYVLPIGVMTALEIGCSNVALRILTVSFGTILKGMAPIFTFSWGLVFGLESFSWRITVCLFTIAFGIVLASLGEGHEFELLGFCLQLFSTCLGGLRWAVTHKLLLQAPSDEGGGESRPTEHMSALNATVYTAPTTTISILPVALIVEGVEVVRHELNDGIGEAVIVWTTMTVIGSFVFCLIMSEYWLVGATSSLALSVTAVFKELLTIGAGILLFSDHVDFLNVLGFSTCQMGILSYVYLRYDNSVAYSAVERETNGLAPSVPPEAALGCEASLSDDGSHECFANESDSLEMSAAGVRHRVKFEDGQFT